MNDDEFQALQEENQHVAELAEAIEEAKTAGLNPDKIMADSRQGYRNLEKMKIKVPGTAKVIRPKDHLNKTGIYSERHSMIMALRNAVKRAKGEIK